MGQSVLFPLGLVLASSDLSFQRALAIFLQHLTLTGSVCYGAFEGSGAFRINEMHLLLVTGSGRI